MLDIEFYEKRVQETDGNISTAYSLKIIAYAIVCLAWAVVEVAKSIREHTQDRRKI